MTDIVPAALLIVAMYMIVYIGTEPGGQYLLALVAGFLVGAAVWLIGKRP